MLPQTAISYVKDLKPYWNNMEPPFVSACSGSQALFDIELLQGNVTCR